MNLSFKAVNSHGNTIKGTYECTCEDELIKNLREHGYYLMDYVPCKSGMIKKLFLHTDILTIALICKQMSVTLKSGVMLPEALIICKNVCRKKAYKKSLNDIYSSVMNGERISSFLEQNKSIYPFIMIQMVKIGEQNGRMDMVMEELSMYYGKEYETRNKIKSSLTYPLIIFLSTALILIILMAAVVPQFVNTLLEMNAEIPMITMHLMNMCCYIHEYALYILLFIILAAILIRYDKRLYKFKYRWDKFKISIPHIGKMIKKINEVRLINIMHMMIRCGYNPLEALKDSIYVIDNLVIKEKIRNCIIKIIKGEQISESLEDTEIFNPVFISLFKTGEKSDKVEECISKAKDIINDGLDENIKRIITCVEPFFIAVLAFIICIIIFSLLMPLISIMDSVQTKL